MRDDEGSGFFVIECFGEGTEYIHLGNWFIVAEDALKVSIFFMQYVKLRKKRCGVFEINKLKSMVSLS